MMSPANYLATLAEKFGADWNRFWYTPSLPRHLARLRIATGLLTLCYLLSWNGSLTRWFGSQGLLPAETVRNFLAENNGQHFHFSPLFALDGTSLWAFQGVAILLAGMFTLGLGTRLTGVLTFLAFLSYVHRAPMLTGPFEAVLAMLLGYLPIGPCGRCWSLDQRRSQLAPVPEWSATLSLRLIQLHTAGFLLLTALSACSTSIWWNGTALWVMQAQTSTRPFDLSWVRNYPFLVNAWTHAFLLVNLLFPVLVWQPLFRPLIVVATAGLWLSVIPCGGQLFYVAAMLIGIASFCGDLIDEK
jgi:hypothetical protein